MRALFFILGYCLIGAHAHVDYFKQFEILNLGDRIRLIAPEQVIRKYGSTRENRSECERDLTLYEEAIQRKESWALRMLDSSSQIPTGVLHGNIIDMGMYDECMTAWGSKNWSQHCMYSIRPRDTDFEFPIDAKLSICLPASCTNKDIVDLFNGAINRTKELKESGLIVPDAMCTHRVENKWSGWKLVIIILVSVYVHLLICCTVMDLCNRRPNFRSQIEEMRVTTSFSILKNAEAILDVESQEGEMPFLHGIRVISALWIALFHEYIVRLLGSINDLKIVWQWYSSWTSTLIFMACYSVDSFFAISGLLLSYNVFKKVNRTKKFINVPLYYLHRYVRFTLPIAIITFMGPIVIPIVSSGAMYKHIIDRLVMPCTTRWWAVLLYINNWLGIDDNCLLHFWSLCVDMQLYIVSPLILYALYKKPKIGLIILGLLILSSGLITSILIRSNKYSVLYVTINPNIPHIKDGLEDVYMQTYTRAIPWLLGIYFGYEMSHKSIKLTKNVIALGWFLAILSFTLCTYGTIYLMREDYEYNVHLESLFAPLSKVFWSFGICWIIYACSNDVAGPITKILSFKYFRPLSKLSYCFYILNITFPVIQTAASRSPIVWDDLVILHSLVGNVTISFVAAFMFCILFEMPMQALDRLYLKEKAEPQRKEKDKETSNLVTESLKNK